MSEYYEYVHHAGYGREDHLADELIARAARRLGASGADDYICAAVGLASHSVPLAGVTVRLPSAPGVRRRMEAALRAASREMRSPDCWVAVACVRVSRVRDGDQYRYSRDERRGDRWVGVSTWCEPVAPDVLAREKREREERRAGPCSSARGRVCQWGIDG